MRVCNEIILNINVKIISKKKLYRVYVEIKKKILGQFVSCVCNFNKKKNFPEGGNQEQR